MDDIPLLVVFALVMYKAFKIFSSAEVVLSGIFFCAVVMFFSLVMSLEGGGAAGW